MAGLILMPQFCGSCQVSRASSPTAYGLLVLRLCLVKLHVTPRTLISVLTMPLDQTVLLCVDRRVVRHCERGLARDTQERERVKEEEKAVNQTTMTAHET